MLSLPVAGYEAPRWGDVFAKETRLCGHNRTILMSWKDLGGLCVSARDGLKKVQLGGLRMRPIWIPANLVFSSRVLAADDSAHH